jgi:dTDP-glucose 4,6-dehydratase
VRGDICDRALVGELLRRHSVDAIVNFAAESHVDRSIDAPGEFVRTNIVGTFELLEAARAYRTTLDAALASRFRLLHVSTDEVFGSLGPTGAFDEQTPYAPKSPYAASKAGADHLVRAYFHTYGMPTLTTNCSNNYGPRQFPEKLIPLVILNALEGRELPVYGSGANVRDWLYVGDHCDALRRVLADGRPGQTYAVGGGAERTNLQVVEALCGLLDRVHPRGDGRSYREQIAFVADRPGHDLRYAIDSSRVMAELGWSPRLAFEEGLKQTVEWYLAHRDWCERITSGVYRRDRLGLGATGGTP